MAYIPHNNSWPAPRTRHWRVRWESFVALGLTLGLWGLVVAVIGWFG